MAETAASRKAKSESREGPDQDSAGRARRPRAAAQRAPRGATSRGVDAPAPNAMDQLQRLADGAAAAPTPETVAAKPARPNLTGLPEALKAGIESLSGLSMDDVRVHHNSSQPAQLNALAYAQGSAIHLAPGQEHHLPHEAWHVVQQRQGRVRPTLQLKEGVLQATAVRAWAQEQRVHQLYLSSITVLELEMGGLPMGRKDRSQGNILRCWVDTLFQQFEGQVLPFAAKTALRCAVLQMPAAKSMRDSMIAATALQHSLTLVTSNVTDFKAMNVKLINPW